MGHQKIQRRRTRSLFKANAVRVIIALLFVHSNDFVNEAILKRLFRRPGRAKPKGKRVCMKHSKDFKKCGPSKSIISSDTPNYKGYIYVRA